MFQSKDDDESIAKKQSIIFLTDFHAEYCFLYSHLQTLRHSDIFEVVTSLRTKCGTCHELSKVKSIKVNISTIKKEKKRPHYI